LAIRKGNLEAVKFALDYNKKTKSTKFSFTLMGGENNLTALYIASYYGKTDIVELLL